MVKLLNPEDDKAAQLQNLQTQLATANQMVVGLKTENDELYDEKKGKIVDNEVKIAIAEITTKAQKENERDSLVADLMTKLHVKIHEAAHEAALQAVQHAHEHSLKDKEIANAQVTQASDQTHEAKMAESSD